MKSQEPLVFRVFGYSWRVGLAGGIHTIRAVHGLHRVDFGVDWPLPMIVAVIPLNGK
jgi:hypothetical protein